MRYALYFTPPKDDALTQAASRWLGRNAFTDEAVPQGETGLSSHDLWRKITDDPRRYGFHATLKAPFVLAPGRSEAELLRALEEFSAECVHFAIPDLVLARLGPFFALVPGTPSPELQDFAAATVRRFEPFRAALSEADIARRKPDTLPENLRRNLMDWGYPYVFEAFEFHMTLTGPVADEDADAVEAVLRQTFAPFIGRPRDVLGLALFTEPARGAPFTVHSLLPLGSIADRKTA